MLKLNTKKLVARFQSLMVGGNPKLVRVYDLGENTHYTDRFTIVFTGRYRKRNGGQLLYIVCNESLSFLARYSTFSRHIDQKYSGNVPKVGGKNHLGKRIPFQQLPSKVQSEIRKEYLELWDVPDLQFLF